MLLRRLPLLVWVLVVWSSQAENDDGRESSVEDNPSALTNNEEELQPGVLIEANDDEGNEEVELTAPVPDAEVTLDGQSSKQNETSVNDTEVQDDRHLKASSLPTHVPHVKKDPQGDDEPQPGSLGEFFHKMNHQQDDDVRSDGQPEAMSKPRTVDLPVAKVPDSEHLVEVNETETSLDSGTGTEATDVDLDPSITAAQQHEMRLVDSLLTNVSDPSARSASASDEELDFIDNKMEPGPSADDRTTLVESEADDSVPPPPHPSDPSERQEDAGSHIPTLTFSVNESEADLPSKIENIEVDLEDIAVSDTVQSSVVDSANGTTDPEETAIQREPSDTIEDSVSMEDNPTNERSDTATKSTPKGPSGGTLPKGSLAEFVQRARGKSNEESESAESPHDDDAEVASEEPTEVVVEAAEAKVSTDEGPVDDTGETDDHVYEVPVWGSTKRYRRQSGLPILYQLFQEPESWEAFFAENYTASPPLPTPVPATNPITTPPAAASAFETRSIEEESSTTAPLNTEDATAATQTPPDQPTNEFVNGLDDIDNLFEDISPPDELDVAGEGTSIQEVVMGSATRVLLKRFRRVAGYLRERITRFVRWTTSKLQEWREKHGSPVSWLRDADGDWAPLRVFRDSESEEWAPLRLLRSEDGDFAPFRKLRDEDGEIAWTQHASVSFQLLKRTSVGIYERFDSVLDSWFSGSATDDDDLDLDFIIDQSTRARRNSDDE